MNFCFLPPLSKFELEVSIGSFYAALRQRMLKTSIDDNQVMPLSNLIQYAGYKHQDIVRLQNKGL